MLRQLQLRIWPWLIDPPVPSHVGRSLVPTSHGCPSPGSVLFLINFNTLCGFAISVFLIPHPLHDFADFSSYSLPHLFPFSIQFDTLAPIVIMLRVEILIFCTPGSCSIHSNGKLFDELLRYRKRMRSNWVGVSVSIPVFDHNLPH